MLFPPLTVSRNLGAPRAPGKIFLLQFCPYWKIPTGYVSPRTDMTALEGGGTVLKTISSQWITVSTGADTGAVEPRGTVLPVDPALLHRAASRAALSSREEEPSRLQSGSESPSMKTTLLVGLPSRSWPGLCFDPC